MWHKNSIFFYSSCICLILLIQNSDAIEKKKVVVDLDIGLDDFVGLVMLFDADNRGEIEIKGLICSYGNAKIEHTCNNLIRAAQIYNKTHIPIFKGLTRQPVADDFFGKDGFEDIHFSTGVDQNLLNTTNVSDALIELIKANPNELSIICLGPLSNFASALEEDFGTVSHLIKDLWIMGGDQTKHAEFNFVNDPNAVDLVLNSGDYDKYILTFDVAGIVSERLNGSWTSNSTSPTMRLINLQTDYINQNVEVYFPCDSYLVSSFLDRSMIIDQQNCEVSIELNDPDHLGVTHFDCSNTANSNVIVIEDIDVNKYLDLYRRLENL